MKQNEQPRIPGAAPALVDELRRHARQLNQLANGDAEGAEVFTGPPTTGTHAQGDFRRNAVPTVASGAVILGWLCTVSGTPGTWVAAKASV
jgi:hypothetical protein